MICQKCRAPLSAHKSLEQVGNSQLAPFAHTEPDSGVQSTVFGGRSEDASFIVLTESLAGPNPLKDPKHRPPKIFTHDAHGISPPPTMPIPLTPLIPSAPATPAALDRLFEYVSTRSSVDMPLCGECAETVRAGLKTSYDEVCTERDAYVGFLNKVRDESHKTTTTLTAEIDAEIHKLEVENAKALAELESAEKDRSIALEELREIRKSICEQQVKDAKVYASRNNYELDLRELKTEQHRLEAITDYQTLQLERLQRTNVYNDVFCIGHDGRFGTINGLRLGRLKDKKVEWAEINAAWGQTLLLLATVINKLGVHLPGYRLRPLGSMSRIEKLELDAETGEPTGRVTSLELYSSGDYSFERLLNHKKLDAAMYAFLDILNQVGKFVEKQDPSLRLPYAIDNDKIGGCSIRLSMNTSNETWTAACKYVLTNAKWILAYVVSRS